MSGEQGLFQDIGDYIRIGKDALDLMKSAWSALPKGESKDEAERKIALAEQALKRSDAALAMKLNYHLCQCTFPPQIMLWRERQKGHFCPRTECGRNTASFSRDFSSGGSDSWKTV